MPILSLEIDRDLPQECKFVDHLIQESLVSGSVSPILRTILVAHCAGLPIGLSGASSYLIDAPAVFQTIKIIETKSKADFTKGPFQYKDGPLRGLWRKHFFQASFMAANMLRENNARRNGGIERIHQALNKRYGKGNYEGKIISEEDIELIVSAIGSSVLDERAVKRKRGPEFGLTGEYIIFQQNATGNNYLTVAEHTDSYEDIWRMVKAELK